MRLRDWLSKGRLRPHEISEKEIFDILRVVRRNLSDTTIQGVSPDRRLVYAPSVLTQKFLDISVGCDILFCREEVHPYETKNGSYHP